MSASKFINHLFGDASGLLALWRSDTKKTEWAENCDPFIIDGFAESANANNFDAYFGVCLQGVKPTKATSRGTEAGVAVMPGLWADVDFASPKKKDKKNYPTEAAAREAVGLLPCEPTITIQSGGGLHLYWLFDEPLLIGDANRAVAKNLSQRWQNLLRIKLLKMGGFDLDSTHDLARVLRLPTTPHTKHPGFSVGLDSYGNNAADFSAAPRYSFDDLVAHTSGGSSLALDFGVAGAAPAASKSKPSSNKGKAKKPAPAKPPATTTANQDDAPPYAIDGQPPMIATEESEPPATKLYNLCEADPKFKAAFDRKMKLESPSEYDMTLANYAMNADWSPAECAGLLVAFAKRHFTEHIPKLLRVTNGWQDYLHRTIGKAMDKSRLDGRDADRSRAIDEISSIVAVESAKAREADEAGKKYEPDVDRDENLERLSEIFGVKVIGWIQTGIESETFSLVVQVGSERREIIIGPAAKFTEGKRGSHHFKAKLYAEAGRVMVITTKLVKEWDCLLQMLRLIVDERRVDEATAKERAIALVREHLSRCHGVYIVTSKSTRREHIVESQPFVESGILHVSSTSLQELATQIDKELTRTKFANAMNQAGFNQKNLHGDNATRSYYFQPLDGLPFSLVKGDDFDPSPERKVKVQ